MKKLLVVVVAVAVGFAFTSCKKNCICSGNYKFFIEGMPDQEVPIPPTSVGELSKSECESYKWNFEVPEGATFTFACKSE